MYAVLSISSPASMCVRSDADGSVGAVSSDLEVHACSSSSDDNMAFVVRSADNSCVLSSDIFSSEVSGVRYMCGGRSDGSVSNISSPAIAAGSEADADRELITFADAIFETAATSKTVGDCSVLMIGVEEFIPYRDVIDPLDLESSCLVRDPCQVVTHVRNHCEPPPDEDGFCSATVVLSCLRSKCLLVAPAAAPMTNLTKLTISWCVVFPAVFLMRMASVMAFATIASFSKRILDLIGWKNKMCRALSMVAFRMRT